jgi:hypothetical protein
LTTLAAEIRAIDQELQVQRQSCVDMQRSIRGMQTRLAALRALAATDGPSEGADVGESGGSPHA